MTIKQLISFGISALGGTALWNIASGADPDRTAAMFGGGFSMLVTLTLMAWMFGK